MVEVPELKKSLFSIFRLDELHDFRVTLGTRKHHIMMPERLGTSKQPSLDDKLVARYVTNLSEIDEIHVKSIKIIKNHRKPMKIMNFHDFLFFVVEMFSFVLPPPPLTKKSIIM